MTPDERPNVVGFPVGPRDHSEMWDTFVFEVPNSVVLTCTICQTVATSESEASAHVDGHLADGSAVVVKEYGRPDRVVPSNSFPETREPTPTLPIPHGRMRVVRGRRFRP